MFGQAKGNLVCQQAVGGCSAFQKSFVVSKGMLMCLCIAVTRLIMLHQRSFGVVSHVEEEGIHEYSYEQCHLDPQDTVFSNAGNEDLFECAAILTHCITREVALLRLE